MLAAFLELLMPVIIVLPGIAAVALAPDLPRPDEAYPHLMAMLPPGVVGLVFAALFAVMLPSWGRRSTRSPRYSTWTYTGRCLRRRPSPFMDREGLVVLACMGLAITVSLAQRPQPLGIDLKNVDCSATDGFNVAALAITVVLIALYAVWW